MTPVDRLLSRLEGVRGRPPKCSAKCPSHEDGSPSLSITSLDDGRVLIHCFAGCSAADVLAAVGLTLGDLFPERLGELTGENSKHREPENKLYKGGYVNMQREIHRLRALVGAK